MNFLVITLLALAAPGTDRRLVPSARLESGGEVESAEMPRDGRGVVAVVKNGKQHDLVAWDIPDRSKSVLLKGVDLIDFQLSPGGRSLLARVCTKDGEDFAGVEFVVWDMPGKSKTSLLGVRKTYVVARPGEFSSDGSLLAIPDGFAKKVHLWKRDAAAKWSVLRVLDVGQGADAPKETLLRLALTPDGKQILALLPLMNGTCDNGLLTVEKWNVTTGRRVPFPMKPMKAFVTMAGQLLFINGERTLWVQRAEGDEEGGAVGIDALSGKRRYNLPLGVAGALVSPDGRTGAVVVWDPGTAPQWAGKPRGPSVASAAFWNFDGGTGLRAVTANSGTEAPLGAFTADSRSFVLAAGDGDHHIHLIDVKKARIRSSFTVSGPVKGLSLLDSGEIAAVGIEPKAIVIWKIKVPRHEAKQRNRGTQY